MKKIDLTDYDVTVRVQDDETKVVDDKTVPYSIRHSLISILFAVQGLTAVDILDRDDLARKIRDCKASDLLLEETEYDKVASAVKGHRGYTQNDVEFVKRVLRAETVTL